MDTQNYGKSNVLMIVLGAIPLPIVVPFCRHYISKYSFIHSIMVKGTHL